MYFVIQTIYVNIQSFKAFHSPVRFIATEKCYYNEYNTSLFGNSSGIIDVRSRKLSLRVLGYLISRMDTWILNPRQFSSTVKVNRFTAEHRGWVTRKDELYIELSICDKENQGWWQQEMKFTRNSLGYKMTNYKINIEIINGLKITLIIQKKNLLVVCKVALRTIILRDNIIRKHWWTIKT